MKRFNKALLQEQLNVEEEIEDVLHLYCQQHKEKGGISKKGWEHAVCILIGFVKPSNFTWLR